MIRECNKAYIGFKGLHKRNPPAEEKAIKDFENLPEGKLKKVITGNWGCGVFGGCPEIKFLIQWIAASKCGRDLVYTTFGN